MADKSKRTSLLRKVFVSAALIALLGLFLTLYYFVYIPQQQTAYNKSTFTILKEISDNFKDRVQGADFAAEKNNGVLGFKKIPADSNSLRQQLIEAVSVPAMQHRSTTANSLSYLLAKKINDSTKRKIQEIFQPIVALHSINFESIVLIKTDSFRNGGFNRGTMIYNSSNLAPDDDVNIDSIYKRKSFFIYPATFDVEIESVDYKLYTLPFSISDQKFIIGGFISNHNYKVASRSFPVLPLIIIAVSLVVILTSLPFLKVFLLSPQESISVKDVRSIIAMIYIIPFVFIMLVSCVWLYGRSQLHAKEAIRQLHEEVTKSFYSEINTVITQLKQYDSSLKESTFGEEIEPAIHALTDDEKATIDLKDAALHPRYYKNFSGLFWIDSSGQEIAKWNFSRDSVYFFNKSDRQYVQDIKRHEGYVLP
ncbi:MAG: hypothetical protein M3040_17530, partial [Bacteroidota bacterium]|nr:hypothetical protein [Bacteroidota bacterium]